MVLCASPLTLTLYKNTRILSNKNSGRGWNTTNFRFPFRFPYEFGTHRRHNLTDYATEDLSKNRANLLNP